MSDAESEPDENRGGDSNKDLHLNDTDHPQVASDPTRYREGTSERSNESKNHADHSKDLGAIPKTKPSRGIEHTIQQRTTKDGVTKYSLKSEHGYQTFPNIQSVGKGVKNKSRIGELKRQLNRGIQAKQLDQEYEISSMDENPTGIQSLHTYVEVQKDMPADVTDGHEKANVNAFDGDKDEDLVIQWSSHEPDSVTDKEHGCASLKPARAQIQLFEETTRCGRISNQNSTDFGESTSHTHTDSYLPTPPITPHKVPSPYERYQCKACGNEQSDELHFSEKLIGKGGFAKVYSVQHKGKSLVRKVFNACPHTEGRACCDKCNESRRREIDTMIDLLPHPNIVTIMGHCDCYHEFLMEEMKGGCMSYLTGKPKEMLSTDQILSFMNQFASALVRIHEKGYIHRDLKGENLLLDETKKTVKIGDFGLTVQLPAGAKVVELKTTGTRIFMAPESIYRKFSQASDIYSFGCCTLQMAVGNLWHLRKNSKGISEPREPNDPPVIPAAVDPKLKSVINWCLQIDPDKRPTASKLYQWLINN